MFLVPAPIPFLSTTRLLFGLQPGLKPTVLTCNMVEYGIGYWT